jgi:hypothetical protein
MSSSARYERFQFDLKGLLAAMAIGGAGLATLRWLVDLLRSENGSFGMVCSCPFWYLSVFIGARVDRSGGGRGIAGGAWGGAIPIVLVVLGSLEEAPVDIHRAVVFTLFGAVLAAFLTAFCLLLIDGAPRDVSRFFYWNWASLPAIFACALWLFGWSELVAPYKPPPPKNAHWIVTGRDERIARDVSPTRYRTRAAVLIPLGLLAFLRLHKTQTPPPEAALEFKKPPDAVVASADALEGQSDVSESG